MTKVGVYLHAGLGNRLFMVAFIYAYSKRNQIKDFGFIETGLCSHSSINYHKKVYPFIQPIQFTNGVLDKEPSHLCISYIEKPKVSMDTIFYGFFQSEKYFKEYRQDLINLFQFPKCPLKLDDKSLFIHIRRGDYINNPVHEVNLGIYNIKCIEYVKEIHREFTLYVISDGIDWCIKNKLFQDIHPNIIYVEDLNELQTISVMKNCTLGGICQNSTFSWWGSYLNDHPNKIVLFPNQWFLHPEYQKYPNEIYFSGSYVMNLETFEVKQIP
jgi:hypothetical protein